MEKKELTCACCGRPLKKDGTPCYNFPNAGIFCLDCTDRVSRFYNVATGTIKFQDYAKSYREMLKKNYDVNFSVSYDKKDIRPFTINVEGERWGYNLSLRNLDDLRRLRDSLTDFIDKCEV